MFDPLPEAMSTEFKPSSERMAEALERARRYWERQNRRLAESSLAAPPALRPPFTIALSYEAGVNGSEVARAIGEELSWHVYDHELLEWIARDMGVRAELLESVDERRTNWLAELLEGLFSGQMVSQVSYAYHLAQVLFSLAAHGECVIVGRGAAQLLPPETTLRLRLVGPLEERIAAVQRRLGRSHEEAARWLEQTEQQQRAFVLDHFQKDPTDPDGYDLLPGAFRYSPPQCAQLTVTALRLLQGQPLRPGVRPA